ncbi:MAG: DUF2721 domain-containing protein [Leptospiraceae bacterium]|nr:DUF2721 domain-containing protein [Leptospiraceae bacterium]
MQLELGTPALLFPAISLLFLAYTNRFVALSRLVRDLHKEYLETLDPNILEQIKNLKLRLYLIRNMQAFGTISIIFCTLTMFLIFLKITSYAEISFLAGMGFLLLSMLVSFWEIHISIKAVNLEISDIEGLIKKT